MRKPAVWAVAVFLLWWSVTLWWVVVDQRLQSGDAAFHAGYTVRVAQLWAEGFWDGISDALFRSFYPPLVYLVCAPAFWLFSHVDALIAWMSVVFGGILTLSLFRVACVLGVPWVGVGAIVLTLSQDMVNSTSRVFLLDFPLAAVVTWAWWRIVVCDRERMGRQAVLLGLVLGIGQLTKWTFGLYVIAPCVWLTYRWLQADARANWRLLAYALLTALAVCGFWYVLRWSDLLAYGSRIAHDAIVTTGHAPSWSLEAWVYYLSAYESVIPLAAWALAAGYCVWRGRRMDRVMVFWTLVGYALLSLLRNRDWRYFVPMIPLISFVTCLGIAHIPRVRWRHAIGTALMVWCAVQLAVLSSHRVDQAVSRWRLPTWASGRPLFGRQGWARTNALPMPDGSVVMPVMDRLETWGRSHPIHVLLVSDEDFERYHSSSTLRLELYKRRLWDYVHIYCTNELSALGSLEAAKQKTWDVVLYYNPPAPTRRTDVTHQRQVLAEVWSPEDHRYQLAEQLTIPSGGVLEIYVPRPAERI